MAISFDNALGIHDDALSFRSRRASVLANNLANLDTPGYKARDMDFSAALKQASDLSKPLAISTTREGHLGESSSAPMGDSELLYRVPSQPSIDGNTVEEHVEHAAYMENSLAFQASFTFLNSKFKGLTNAIRGE